ncbi:hypothetical protein HYT01_01655 [Candidatus Giovannonibacteria bacterium]|nr:hypothetical protein [Candidatus Giovannonibacteria bacterium]
MDYLPSKKFIVLAASAATVILAGWAAYYIWNLPVGPAKLAENEVDNNTQFLDAYADAELDTDKDGLKDWEELLWKTDPQKGDSDGDGTVDGEEIAAGRDPSIAGPKDKLPKPEELAAVTGTDTPMTLTGKIARDFVAEYFSQKGAAGGGAIAQAVKNKIESSVFFQVQKGVAAYSDVFTMKDVKKSDSADTRKYLNDLGKILDVNFKNITESESDIMNSVAESNDFTKLDALDDYMTAYSKTVKSMQNLTVPTAYSALHLTLLNSMQNTFYAAQNMKLLKDDPIRGLIGFQLYSKEVGRAREYLIDLKAKVEKDIIVFSDSESGSFFNQYFEKLNEAEKNNLINQ